MSAVWESNTKICTTDLRQGPIVFLSLISIKDLDFLILFLTLKRLRFPPLWLKINTKKLLSLCCSEKPCCKSSLHLPAWGYNASWKASSDTLCVGLSLPFETMETNYVLHKQRQPSINILLFFDLQSAPIYLTNLYLATKPLKIQSLLNTIHYRQASWTTFQAITCNDDDSDKTKRNHFYKFPFNFCQYLS